MGSRLNRNLRLLVLVVIISVAIRVSLAIFLGDSIEEVRGGTYDQISYDALAQRVISGHGFSFAINSWPYARAGEPTAFWSYLYTLYLAAIYTLFGHHPLLARVVQGTLVGVCMPYLSYRLGVRAFNRRVGLLASGAAAIYAYFILYAVSLMTEAFYIVGILWSFDSAFRLNGEGRISPRHGWFLGLELGFALAFTILLRQVAVIVLPILFVWMLLGGWKRHRLRLTFTSNVISVAVMIALMAPFVIRNYKVFGRMTLPNTNAGFAFFWSNHPIFGTRFEPVLSPDHGVSYQELVPVELRKLNEAALDRALLRRGWNFVTDDPLRFVMLSASRIPVYFLFWPTSESSLLSNLSRIFSFSIALPLMVYGSLLSIYRLFLAGRPELSKGRGALAPSKSHMSLRDSYQFILLLFVFSYTFVHIISWANVRYRLPVDAILILFAAYGIDHLLRRWSAKYRHFFRHAAL